VVRANSGATITNLDDLLDALRKASAIRNVLCHGSWRMPDKEGRSLPLFVNKKREVFQTLVDVAYLKQVQSDVAELVMPRCEQRDAHGLAVPGLTWAGIANLAASAWGAGGIVNSSNGFPHSH
jgi:hypothetical protein